MQTASVPDVILGSGEYRYKVDPFFAKVPAGMELIKVGAVAVDGSDNVYAFVRKGSAPIMIFNSKGDFLASWGVGEFGNPHGLHITGDHIYCTDDGKHVVRKYTLDGKFLLEIGVPGQPAPAYSGRPFSRCTHTALSPDHETIYVSDGYANATVHAFTQTGKHIKTWGSPGMDDGQFMLPHNICCDDSGRVYVADREAHRVQIFDGDGNFETAWHNLHRACSLSMDMGANGLVYCGELANQYKHIKALTNVGPRVTVLNKDGKVMARLNNDKASHPSYQFIIPHGIANDSKGNIYVADTQSWWAEQHPDIPPAPGPGTLKKLIRL